MIHRTSMGVYDGSARDVHRPTSDVSMRRNAWRSGGSVTNAYASRVARCIKVRTINS